MTQAHQFSQVTIAPFAPSTESSLLEEHICSDNLKNTLGMILSVCLQELVEAHPRDPISFMAQWLYKYADNRRYFESKATHFTTLGTKVSQVRKAKLKEKKKGHQRHPEMINLLSLLPAEPSNAKLTEPVQTTSSFERYVIRGHERMSRVARLSLEYKHKIKLGRGIRKGQREKRPLPAPDRRRYFDDSWSTSSYSSSYSSTLSRSSSYLTGSSISSPSRSWGSARDGDGRAQTSDDKERNRERRVRDERDDKRSKRMLEHARRTDSENFARRVSSLRQSKRRGDRYRDDDEYDERRDRDSRSSRGHRHRSKSRGRHGSRHDDQDYPEDTFEQDDRDRAHRRRRSDNRDHRHHRRQQHEDEFDERDISHRRRRSDHDRDGRQHRKHHQDEYYDEKDRSLRKRRSGYDDWYKDKDGRRQQGHRQDDDERDRSYRRSKLDKDRDDASKRNSKLEKDKYGRPRRGDEELGGERKHSKRDRYGHDEYDEQGRPYRRRGDDERDSDRARARDGRDYRSHEERQRARVEDQGEYERYRTGMRQYDDGKETPLSGADSAHTLDDFSPSDEEIELTGTPSKIKALKKQKQKMRKMQRNASRAMCRWGLSGSPPVLTCYHQILGTLRSPHRDRISVEKADLFWASILDACEVLYDQEIYTVCDPQADDELYQDRMAEWTGDTWNLTEQGTSHVKIIDDTEQEKADDLERQKTDDAEHEKVDDHEQEKVDHQEQEKVDDQEQEKVDDQESEKVDDREREKVDDRENEKKNDRQKENNHFKEKEMDDGHEMQAVDNRVKDMEDGHEIKTIDDGEKEEKGDMEKEIEDERGLAKTDGRKNKMQDGPEKVLEDDHEKDEKIGREEEKSVIEKEMEDERGSQETGDREEEMVDGLEQEGKDGV